ncbi:hypothetical protein HN51_062138, partial [Arachis hypogaea]
QSREEDYRSNRSSLFGGLGEDTNERYQPEYTGESISQTASKREHRTRTLDRHHE